MKNLPGVCGNSDTVFKGICEEGAGELPPLLSRTLLIDLLNAAIGVESTDAKEVTFDSVFLRFVSVRVTSLKLETEVSFMESSPILRFLLRYCKDSY